MTKYLLIALVALAALLGALLRVEGLRADAADAKASSALEHAKAAEKALAKANEQLALQRSVSLARQQELNRLRHVAEQRQKALDEALQASPDWARTPAPASVWDALTRPGAAGPAGPRVDGADPRARPAAGP